MDLAKVFRFQEIAIVGASGHNSTQGQAYIFRRIGSGWIEQAILSASDGAAVAAFGIAVGVSGDYAIVGAYQQNVNGNFVQGQSYIFNK